MTTSRSLMTRPPADTAGPDHPATSAATRSQRRLLACGAVAGPLFVAAAAGLRRTLAGGPGRRWMPRLLTIAGAGLAGGGIFHPDPSGGFPPGTALQASAVSSWHGALHEVCGSVAFLALIALCFVVARRYRAEGQRGLAACSVMAGLLCLAGVASGGAPHGSLTLFAGVAVALLWTSFTTARQYRRRSVWQGPFSQAG